MFKQIATLLFLTYPCAKGAAVHRILCLCSKFEVYVPGSRARLGDRGQQRKEKEEQGGTRDLESPGQGWRMPEEMVVGLRQNWVHPKPGHRRGGTLQASLSREEKDRGGGNPKIQPKVAAPVENTLGQGFAKLVLQGTVMLQPAGWTTVLLI